ncbi:MAG: TIGR03986 family CRISPR-associated RAMP protein [Anaerolineae bacterium]|nr:TIGR03986 family CRISPR-associated RAMP protein [Anaerolineae bacterium]
MSKKGKQGGNSGEQGGRGLAHAPYNFVPLPDKVVSAQDLPDQDCYHADRYSGYFTVTLTTETPLYIRGLLTEAEAADAEKHKNKPDFFERNGKPVIPGSSLRGMLRNLVEIITFSKLTRVSDKPKIFFRAVAAKTDDPLGEDYKKVLGQLGKNVQAGFLEQRGEEWFIRPASQRNGKTFAKVRDLTKRGDVADDVAQVRGVKHLNQPDYTVQYIDVKLLGEPESSRAGLRAKVRSLRQGEQRDGVLVCTGNMAESSSETGGRVKTNRKNFVVVFEADPRANPLQIDPQAVEDYLDGLTPFQQETPFDPKFGCLVSGRPVFYIPPERGEKVFYFGHAPFFRISAMLTESDSAGNRLKRAVTPRDCIPEAVRDNPNHYDMAEALFGFVDKAKDAEQGDKRRAYASRVSVSDAVITKVRSDGYYEREIVPKILGGPKPTTFQHYLEQPPEAYTDKSKLSHYATMPLPDLRGHKLYWRQRGTTIDDVRESDPEALRKVESGSDTQHTRMKPVKAGVEFKFTVRFENLTAEELGALAWALYLPCSAEARHQLGMGKPYGMGVVKLEPELRLIDRKARYMQLFSDDDWAKAEDRGSPEQFISAFEKYIVEKLNERRNFRDIPRIRELCIMLTPQPRSKAFEYMRIEPENEYKDRPVLPRPSQVVSAQSGTPLSHQASSVSAASVGGTLFTEGTVLEGRVVRSAPAHKPFEVLLRENGQVVTVQGNESPRQEGNMVYLKVEGGAYKPISRREADRLRKEQQS